MTFFSECSDAWGHLKNPILYNARVFKIAISHILLTIITAIYAG
jgi:hypothetical protein